MYNEYEIIPRSLLYMWKYVLTIIFVILSVVMLFFGVIKNQEASTQNVSFYAVGDNLIHPAIYENAMQEDGTFDFKPMYKPLKQEIKNFDIAYINQESPIGGDEKGLSGFKQFNTPQAIAGDLVDIGFNVVNGSNNHALDQGTEGLVNEINLWKDFEDVFYTGTFESQKKRDQVNKIKVNGIDIAFLSYTYGTNDISADHAYQVNYFDKKQIEADIQKAKSQSDAVVISAHWGNEGKHQPNDMQKKYAKIFANAGADVVLGTHPHVIQPVEWVQGKGEHQTLVAYSLGNFLNAQEKSDESNFLGGNIQFNIVKKGDDVKINQVAWKSLVTHYEIPNPYNDAKRQNFKMYELKDYSNDKANMHGLKQSDRKNNMSRARLVEITKEVIDKQYLNEDSY